MEQNSLEYKNDSFQMGKGVGIREIAKIAKVSIGTIDRVIHNRTGVSEATKKHILGIINELEYKPNILARRLASKKTVQYAILIPSVDNDHSFWQEPLRGIHKALDEISSFGVKMEQFLFSSNDKTQFILQSKKILNQNFNGIVIAPVFVPETKEFIIECEKRNIPYVFINSDIQEQSRLCYIGPNLIQSGYLAAHLICYKGDIGKILIVNISKELTAGHQLLQKEEGFRKYFKDHGKTNELVTLDIEEINYPLIKTKLWQVFKTGMRIKAIFVTNTSVFYLGRFLEELEIKDVLLIGFDFLEENIEYLKKGVIDFLICQKPIEQGYKGIMTLFQSTVLENPVQKEYFMPIDIITKENYLYYK